MNSLLQPSVSNCELGECQDAHITQKFKDMINENGKLIVEDGLKSNLFITRCAIKEQKILLEQYKKIKKPERVLNIEIQAGSDFGEDCCVRNSKGSKIKANKIAPIIEITQDISQVPRWRIEEINSPVIIEKEDYQECEDTLNSIDTTEEEESSKIITKTESFDNSLRKEVTETQLKLSTPPSIRPNIKGIYDWNCQGKFYFKQDIPEKSLTFSISLLKSKIKYSAPLNRKKAVMIGKPKSFFCMNLRSQKVEEIELDFRESFDSETEGKVFLRVQYIYDQISLINDVLASLKRSEELILTLLDKLQNITISQDLRISTFQKTSVTLKDTFYNGGRFFSGQQEENKNSSIVTEQTSSDNTSDSKGFFMVGQILEQRERSRSKIYSFKIPKILSSQKRTQTFMRDDSLPTFLETQEIEECSKNI
ncbi:unnamed protein product [Moneuplotes crassus]|uniref:Uncharacterized protein n=1 Tax=Euplotes crassus TaxID=5936 RepID=A0AAD1X979_EUPCR|nr:unnamed protein product [Moneuplotes crassus]